MRRKVGDKSKNNYRNMQDRARRVAVFGNIYQSEKSSSAEFLLRELQDNGFEPHLEEQFSGFLRSEARLDVSGLPRFSRIEELDAAFAVSMGGDGTFLRTAAEVRDSNVPILGVNTGHMGFLADVSSAEISEAIASLKAGNYKIDERSLIRVETDAAALAGYPYALNEVALLKYDNSSLISVATHVGDELLANYVADGLIICTPTGSTGYSMSVGGPIIVPASHSLCISAVAPHSLSVRPVIVTDDVEIELHVKSRSKKFLIAIDGRSEVLDEGIVVRLRRAAHTIRVLKVCRQQFFDTLRDKMQWGADQRLR